MAEHKATARQLAPPAAGAPRRTPLSLQVVRAPRPGVDMLRAPSIVHVRIDAFAVAVAVRAQPALRDQALIAGGDAQGRGNVLAALPAAREEGVQPGMTLRAAEKLCPHALVLPVDPQAIEAAAQEVLNVLGRYTPDVEPAWITRRASDCGRMAQTRRLRPDEESGSQLTAAPSAGHSRQIPSIRPQPEAMSRLARCFGATLDVHGCDRLFGPPTTIAEAIGAELAAHGFTARLGVAANPSLAAVASAVATVERPISVLPGREREFLESIPLTLFEEFDLELLDRLHALGIRAAGQFARLPEAGVRRRFGQAGRLAHEQARGVARRPVVTPPAPAVLEAVCNLEDPTTDGLWLDRELARLAEQLAAKLAARGQSAGVLTLGLVRERPDVGGRLYLKQPVAGAPAILDRARELLAQLAPSGPVGGIRLEAAALAVAATQSRLPLVDAKLAGHERLEAVAQRLCGRFGPRAARRAHLVADAVLPEDRVVWDGPATLSTPRARSIEVRVDGLGRPVAVRRDPRAWESLRTICSHWRIRTNWWSTSTHRHYYLVETMQGAVLEIYQEQHGGTWHLAGRRD